MGTNHIQHQVTMNSFAPSCRGDKLHGQLFGLHTEAVFSKKNKIVFCKTAATAALSISFNLCLQISQIQPEDLTLEFQHIWPPACLSVSAPVFFFSFFPHLQICSTLTNSNKQPSPPELRVFSPHQFQSHHAGIQLTAGLCLDQQKTFSTGLYS